MVSISGFKDVMPLNRNTLLLWVLEWHQEGSVKDNIPQGYPFLAPAPDRMEQIRDAML